jgi:hypothetical protein
MMVFADAVDATFAAFGIDAVYTPAGGEPVPVRVIAKRPDTIVGFGETRIHAATATFEVRASEVANPRPGDQLIVGGETFVIQREPERRDPDRLVRTWTFGQPDVVRLQPRAVLCWLPQGESNDVAKSLFACLGRHLLPRRSAPSGTDRLWLERGNWRLERTDVAELGCTHRGRRVGLLRVQLAQQSARKNSFS